MGAVKRSWHDKKQTVGRYELKAFPFIRIHALDQQMSGAVWMMKG